MEPTYENRPVIIFGDSYTVYLGNIQEDLTAEGLQRLKLCACMGLSLYGYFIGKSHYYGWRKDRNTNLINAIDIGLGKWHVAKEKYKNIKNIDIFLSFGQVDIYGLFYKDEEAIEYSNAGKYHESKHFSNLISNYEKLIIEIRNTFNDPIIHLIGLQPYFSVHKQLISRGIDFKDIAKRKIMVPYQIEKDYKNTITRLFIVDKKLKEMSNTWKVNYIDVLKHMYNKYNNDYYNVYYSRNRPDFHTDPFAIRELLRLESPILKKIFKSDDKALQLIMETKKTDKIIDIKPNEYDNESIHKKGGYIGTISTSIYVIFIIILLFLYFIYVYQENIYSVIYNGRNTLCNSVYPSFCISKG